MVIMEIMFYLKPMTNVRRTGNRTSDDIAPRLGARRSEVRILARTVNVINLQNDQTGSETYPVSYAIGTAFLPHGKATGAGS